MVARSRRGGGITDSSLSTPRSLRTTATRLAAFDRAGSSSLRDRASRPQVDDDPLCPRLRRVPAACRLELEQQARSLLWHEAADVPHTLSGRTSLGAPDRSAVGVAVSRPEVIAYMQHPVPEEGSVSLLLARSQPWHEAVVKLRL